MNAGMFYRRGLLGMLIAALTMFFMAGSATAAVSCASPMMEIAMPTRSSSDCPGPKSHDCALACAPMCAAVAPQLTEVSPPAPTAASYHAEPVDEWTALAPRLEPPPPRMA
jgi:hypothetical protein